MKIVVTVPAYNEEKTIGILIDDIKKVMNENKYDYKIIVIDDGSKDNTAQIAKQHGAVVYKHNRNLGLAFSFRTEIKKCLENDADIIVHIDADRQYLPSEIPMLIKEINRGYDLVLGSRFLGKIESMPLINRIGNKAFSWVISHISRSRISDAQTGFRAFTKKVAKEINIISNHTYTQEQIIKAVKHNVSLKEVPIHFLERKGKSRLISSPFSYAFRAWINILRIYRDYEPLKFFGFIGSMIFFLGTIIGGYLLYLHIFSGGLTGHFPLIMFDVLILSFGVQIIIFGFLADMQRKD